MSKKIVVITGSPRKKGNSFAMCRSDEVSSLYLED